MDKLENWIIFGLLAAIYLKTTPAASQTPTGCTQATSTGWGVSDLLNSNAQAGTLAGMGCRCDYE